MATSGSVYSESSLELRNITKHHSGAAKPAVDDISLSVAPGEFITLLGPSGCGKSTTLHLMAGLDVPTRGTVHINDRDVTRLSPRERDVALVFQSYALYPHMTVEQNIAFPLQLKSRRLSKTEIRGRVTGAVDRMSLSDLRTRVPAELSGGQRQRVALARALVRVPSVFLFDEPLSNLDTRLRVKMRAQLKELHQIIGATMVYVTHDQAEAMVLSDRIAVMDAGKIQQIGAPLELYHRPANLFVARFIGEFGTNILEGGEVVATAGGAEYHWRHFILSLANHPSAMGRASLGLRPENVEVCAVNSAELSGHVKIVEPYGDHTRVRVMVENVEVIAAAEDGFTAPSGSQVGLRVVDRDRITLFDELTGRALPSVSAHHHVAQ